ANCFIESGHGKAFLIDFNYEVEPMPGNFPLAHLGPFKLLKETKMNHLGKLMFKWAYWNILLKGKELPVGPEMSLKGKILDEKILDNINYRDINFTDKQQISKLSGGR
ncbi:MAG: hypothetical protein ABI543_11765, partial [Ignavibacteria bacterium]